MYDMIPFITGAVAILLGLLMFSAPKSSASKEKRDNPQEVEKVKSRAWIVVGIGILMILIGLV